MHHWTIGPLTCELVCDSNTICTTGPCRHLTLTASTGKEPAAVSPLSMTQSVPSSTAFATSVASARVGLGFLIILSNIWVAVMTGLPASEEQQISHKRHQNIITKVDERQVHQASPEKPEMTAGMSTTAAPLYMV